MNSAPGLGKTHLAQAVGRAIAEERSGARVGYLTAEDFASRFVASLRTHEVENFKNRFRDLDVLLLEDVHFFQGKEKMQDMALAVVKSLQAKGGRVIFTSSFSPRELQHVDSQLVSHFCSGILTDIGRPTEDMRRNILERKAKNFQVLLPDPVCELLACRLDGDVRQMESCLNSLIFKARLLNCGLNLDLAMGEVGISLMLGGNIAGRTNTLSLEVFNAVSAGEFQRASLLCAVLAVISLLLYLGIDWCQKRSL